MDVREKLVELLTQKLLNFEKATYLADYLVKNGVTVQECGRWECVYDDSTGETDITCSHCKNTRTVNGCFVSTDGKSCYFEDDYCPNCGAKMDGGDDDG